MIKKSQIKIYKPTTDARRKMSVVDYSILSRKKGEKSLMRVLNKKAGRDNTGQISVRHQGSGEKQKYRVISALSDFIDKPGKVEHLEYDPNRTSFIVLVRFEDKSVAYILAWEGVEIGQKVIASEKGEVTAGNRTHLANIPNGIGIFDIEMQSGQGGKLVRGAGAQAFITAKEGDWVHIKMPSGEVRRINKKCFATIGQASNVAHSLVRYAKAGRKRHMGIRPSVRGKAMHPDAHPHGGGEGNNPIGLKYPKTPWGKHAFGVRTRKKSKYSDNMIIKRRAK